MDGVLTRPSLAPGSRAPGERGARSRVAHTQADLDVPWRGRLWVSAVSPHPTSSLRNPVESSGHPLRPLCGTRVVLPAPPGLSKWGLALTAVPQAGRSAGGI